MKIKEQFEIEPNSKTALYTPLTGLNADQMMHMVLSSGFVPEHVRYNTIIWDNWDIFSHSKYNWTVVRKQPSLVKLWTTSNVCFVCVPSRKEKGMYEVKYLKPFAKRLMLLPELPEVKPEIVDVDAFDVNQEILNVKKFHRSIPLKEAVERIEKYLRWNDSKGHGEDLLMFPTEYYKYNFANEEEVEIEFKKHYLQHFQKAGVDKVSMQQLIREQNPYTLEAALQTLTQDIEPDEDTLKEILGGNKYAYLFTKRELRELREFREGSQQKQYAKGWLMQYKIESQREAKTDKQ